MSVGAVVGVKAGCQCQILLHRPKVKHVHVGGGVIKIEIVTNAGTLKRVNVWMCEHAAS